MRRFGELFGRSPEKKNKVKPKERVSLAQRQADYDAERDAWLDQQRDQRDAALELEQAQNQEIENERKGEPWKEMLRKAAEIQAEKDAREAAAIRDDDAEREAKRIQAIRDEIEGKF